MASRKLSVVISQAPGKNPNKRHLEETIAASLMMDGTADVSLVPHLNDLSADHSGVMWMKSIRTDMVVLAWLYPRASHWILDRQGIKGREGTVLLRSANEDEDEEAPLPPEERGGIGALNLPKRSIYNIDLRTELPPEVYLSEIRRIAREATTEMVSLGGLELFSKPAPAAPASPPAPSNPATAFQPLAGILPMLAAPSTDQTAEGSDGPMTLLEGTKRRWYPVIDYSRCTNCMECIDFCLFGVYGLDPEERILVEQQDNCKKGCPACSRVCPANAIIFPDHKTPAIAGAPVSGVADFKIDLSKLFGAPSALELAVMERDTELVADGRNAVGMSVGIPKRQDHSAHQPKDELDSLIDGLDDF